MMTLRRTRLALRLATVACAAAAAAVIVAGLTVPRETTALVDRATPGPRPAATTGPAAAPSPDAFGVALDRPLRPPLGEAQTAVGGAASAPASGDETATLSQRLTLVGTVGESVALIRGPDGRVALVEVGDDVEGADVISIRAQQVDLRQGGRLIRLQKSPPPGEPPDSAIR